MLIDLTREQLRSFLAGELSEADQDDVCKHVERCSRCQLAMEELIAAGEGPEWSSWRHEEPDLRPDESFLMQLKVYGPPPEWSSAVQGPSTLKGGGSRLERGPGDLRDPECTPVIRGYEVFHELGRGGMGVVYLAREVRLNRPCALKMILAAGHAGPEAVVRFLAEVEAIARLRHPNIVGIHGAGDHEGHPYLELEYVEGGSLAQALNGTPWPPRRAATLIEALAGAMAEAHRLGIVHRDLKPGNILLSADGAPKVTDFGLAKSLGESGSITRTGAILGSPSYRAPEQAEGGTKGVGPAADSYALGAILYELLTGRPPFRGATVTETLQQVRLADPVPPSRLVPGLPRDVETVCLKCLAKDPAWRYESALALREDLRRFVAGEPIRARPVGPLERAWRWGRRNPALAAVGGVAAAALTGLVVTLAASNVAQSRANRTLVGKESELNQALAQARAERERAQGLVAELSIDRATTAGEDGLSGAALLWMAQALKEARGSAPQLEATIRAGLAAWGGQCPGLLRIFEHGSDVGAVAISPDGRTASTDDGTTIRLWDLTTGRPKGEPIRPSGFYSRASFNPDGATLRTTPWDGLVQTWNVDTGGVAGPAFRLPGGSNWTVPSPDDSLILTDDGPTAPKSTARTYRLRDARTGEPRGVPIASKSRLRHAKFSPDSSSFFLVDESVMKELRLFDPTAGKAGETTVAGTADITCAEYSPDSRTILIGRMDNTVALWNVATGQPAGPLWIDPRRQWGQPTCLAFSPDGATALIGSMDGVGRLWEVATGESLGHSVLQPGIVTSAGFGPDGRTILTGSRLGMARLWDLSGFARASDRVLPHAAGVALLEQSPDGRILLTGTRANVARLWDATGRPIGPPMPSPGALRVVAFSPDGKSVLTGGGVRYDQPFARLWDAAGRPISPVLRHNGAVVAAAFSPDGLFAATGSYDNHARVWDVAHGGRPVGRPIKVGGQCYCLAFSPDGTALLTGDERGTTQLWDVCTQKPLGPPMQNASIITTVAFSPDGQTALTGCDDGVARLWDLATSRPIGEEMRHSVGINGIQTAAFSPDGKAVLTAGTDRTARIWGAVSGLPRGMPLAHADVVASAAFSPDGRSVVTACFDGAAYVWDVATSQRIGPSLRHGRRVNRAAFSPDGGRVWTAGEDGTVRSWPMTHPREGAAEPIARWAEGWTGMRIGEGHAIRTLRPDEVHQRLTEPGRLTPEEPRSSAEQEEVLAWHESRANLALAEQMWSAALWHLERLARVRREDPWVRVRRVRALLGLHRDSAADVELGRLLVSADSSLAHDAPLHDAYEAEAAHEWATALFYFNRLVASRRDDSKLSLHLARVLAALGRGGDAEAAIRRAAAADVAKSAIRQADEAQEWARFADESAVDHRWGRAARLLAGACRRDPAPTPILWNHYALACLAAGDKDGYRALCARLARPVGAPSTGPSDTMLLAWTLVLGPHAGADLAPSRDVLLGALASLPRDAHQPRHDFLFVLGAILYRDGQPRAAIDRIEEALVEVAGRGYPTDWAFLSMAHHRLGHANEARHYLQKVPTAGASVEEGHFWDDLEVEMLRREAEALVTGGQTDLPEDVFAGPTLGPR